MTRTLVFVETRADVGPPDPSVDVVVLDASWTPAFGERLDLIPLRPALAAVLDRVNLYDGCLDVLDRWEAARGAANLYRIGRESWWFRVRLTARWPVHESMLWRLVLDELAPADRYGRVVIPAVAAALVAAAQAARPGRPPFVVEIVAEAADDAAAEPGATGVVATSMDVARRIVRLPRRSARRVRRGVAHALGRPAPQPVISPRAAELARRAAVLGDRVERLMGQPGAVLAVATAGFFQVTHEGGRTRSVDPYLAPVIDRLVDDGVPVATLGLQLDQRRDTDWAHVEADTSVLPQSMFRGRWGRPEDDLLDAPDVDGMLAEVGPPLLVGGADLASTVSASVASFWTSRWMAAEARTVARAERMLLDLRPSVLFLDHEGGRTAYVVAARRLGIPIVVVQHGVIYPGNPEYCHPLLDGLVRADLTCVFGTYERDVLVDQAGFDPTTVLVTGSARSDPDHTADPASPTERADVRRDLGVAEGDRTLVVSVAHNPVAGDLHSVNMVGRMLGGPLPGVHVVFKLHPMEKSEGRYRATLEGMARASGYDPPPISVVRDYDLFRLLRAADAHLGQYSTVLTDAILAGTPSMIAIGFAYSDILGYVDAGVAVPVRSVDDVRAFMADPRPPDPADRARFLARHFQPGDATGRIVAAIAAVSAASVGPTRSP